MRGNDISRRMFAGLAVIAAGMLAFPAIADENWLSEELRLHPLAGKIYEPSSRTFITEATLLERLVKFPHVLLGEIHDNADHHRLQARIIRGLVKRGRRPAVVVEMIDAKQAGSLEGILVYNRDFGDAAPDALRLALQWNKSGWPPFEIYEPVFAAALGNKLTITAGEPVPETPDAVGALIETAPLSDTHQAALIEELKVSHCGVLPDPVVPKIAIAQRKRDAKLTLAMQAAGIAGGDGTVLITGSGHARVDRGVPHYLRDVGETSVTVIFTEVSPESTEAADGFEPGTADYIWFTPRHKRDDPCVALRKKFGKAAE